MPRKFFRQFALNRDEISRRWYLQPFKKMLGQPRLFHVSRRSVVPAIAIGLFCAWFPIPGQMLLATLGAIVFRANIPLAALTTLVSNPVTMGPLFYLGYRVGRAILQTPALPFNFELSWEWLTSGMASIAEPMFVGCFVLASATAAISHVSLNLLWRASVAASKKARRLRKSRNV